MSSLPFAVGTKPSVDQRTAHVKRIRPLKRSHRAGVADQAGTGLPCMNAKSAGLQVPLRRRFRVQIKHHLVGRCRAGRGQGTGKPHVNGTVQMAANHTLDIGVPGYQLRQLITPESSPILSMWPMSVVNGG